jgi:hypothetical protein
LRAALQVSADALDRPRPRVAAVAEIEDETGISHRIPAETGRRSSILTEKPFHFS